MFIFLLFVTCFLTVINGDQTVIYKIPTPRGSSRDVFVRSITDYWTPDRMAKARSKDVLTSDEVLVARFVPEKASDSRVDGPPQPVPITLPTVSKASSSFRDSSMAPRVVGRVFFTINGGNYSCSAAVITASNQDCVITAGHCVYDYASQQWASNWIFVPQYNKGSTPFGIWVARSLITKLFWMNYGD
jgi:hypothetical protein